MLDLSQKCLSEVFMIPLPTAVSVGPNSQFNWSRSGRIHTLAINGETAGTLEQPSFWCSKMVASTTAGQWTFRQAGTLRSGAEILDQAGQFVAVLTTCWGGPATLTFNDGQTFLIKAKGVFHPVWSVSTPDSQIVMQLDKRERRVEVMNGASTARDRIALLALFVLYRMWQADQDAAAAVVAAVS
jgi:hypothetical protein